MYRYETWHQSTELGQTHTLRVRTDTHHLANRLISTTTGVKTSGADPCSLA